MDMYKNSVIKSLFDISWQVPEEVYREDHALSYSTLAKYERGGFKSLPTLFDKVESPALTFGSAVDALMTGGENEFNERFVVADFPSIPDSYIVLIKEIFNIYGTAYNSIVDVPDKDIIPLTEKLEFQRGWKPETRAKVIKEKGSEYYKLLFLSVNKTLLSTEVYNQVINCVNALKTAESTKFWFAPNNPFDNSIERLYQLKFKTELNGVIYRCMADLIVVDYNKKTIQPIDLKTSSHAEYEFYKSFISWSYQIQSRLYWRIIKKIVSEDEFFKDFTVLPYKFIVVCKETLNPLVWDCPFTAEVGDICVGKNKQILLRDPETIGQELFNYLKETPIVPNGISLTTGNDLLTWLNTYE
jgi:hypothetical protein